MAGTVVLYSAKQNAVVCAHADIFIWIITGPRGMTHTVAGDNS